MKLIATSTLPRTANNNAQQEALRQIKNLLTKEFTDSPFNKLIFPNPATRRHIIPWITSIRLFLSLQSSYIVIQDGYNDKASLATLKVLAHAIVTTPEVGGMKGDPSFWDIVRSGFLLFPFYFGVRAFLRQLEFMRTWKQYMVVACGGGSGARGARGGDGTSSNSKPYGTVELLVVDETMRGKGIGKFLLSGALEMARASRSGSSSSSSSLKDGRWILSTQTERNIKFYEKFGFRVLYDKDFEIRNGLGDGRGGGELSRVQNWMMELVE
ncbi:hypothetical protein BDR26DRAFT_854342 [Obelidium mucronatum]|nr:hypothetical protein BDR26DRAFT_854342 [Obelidium mucronatum]